MWRYIVRRLLWVVVVVVVLIITAFTYVIFFVMPPTDPAVQFAGRSPTPELIAEVRRQFGLDKPIWQQYTLFLKHTFTGDQYGWPGLGFSFVTRSPVRDQLIDRWPVTVQLALGAALVWLCIGIPIGIISAIKRGSLLDRASMLLALFLVSAPVFWLGLVALWLFWYQLGWSPGTGYVPIGESFGGWLGHMLLPWVVLALLFAAQYARMTRGNLLETMAQDYIRTARVKGLPEWKVVLIVYAYLDPKVTYQVDPAQARGQPLHWQPCRAARLVAPTSQGSLRSAAAAAPQPVGATSARSSPCCSATLLGSPPAPMGPTQRT